MTPEAGSLTARGVEPPIIRVTVGANAAPAVTPAETPAEAPAATDATLESLGVIASPAPSLPSARADARRVPGEQRLGPVRGVRGILVDMTESNAVAGFLPSTNGLHFANRWEPGPTIRFGLLDPRLVGVGDAKAGLCGGMSWFVRERFGAGQPIPADVTAPANGSPLFRAIVRRQILSLDLHAHPAALLARRRR